MAQLIFPANPTDGQIYTGGNGVTYTYKSPPGVWGAPTGAGGAIETPTIVSPPDNSTGQGNSSGVTITSSAYTQSGGGSHVSTTWEMYRNSPFAISTNPISSTSTVAASWTELQAVVGGISDYGGFVDEVGSKVWRRTGGLTVQYSADAGVTWGSTASLPTYTETWYSYGGANGSMVVGRNTPAVTSSTTYFSLYNASSLPANLTTDITTTTYTNKGQIFQYSDGEYYFLLSTYGASNAGGTPPTYVGVGATRAWRLVANGGPAVQVANNTSPPWMGGLYGAQPAAWVFRNDTIYATGGTWAGGSNSTIYASSDKGSSWSAVATCPFVAGSGAFNENTGEFVFGSSLSATIAISSDLVNFRTYPLPTIPQGDGRFMQWQGLFFYGGALYINGGNNSLYTSTDGVTWTQTSNTPGAVDQGSIMTAENYVLVGGTSPASPPGSGAYITTSPAGVTTINVTNAQSDGFRVGDVVSSYPQGYGSGSITAVSDSSVSISPTSSWASAAGKYLYTSGAYQVVGFNTPVSLTSLFVDRQDLSPLTDYFVRCQYFGSTRYSQFSPWSKFTTGNL